MVTAAMPPTHLHTFAPSPSPSPKRKREPPHIPPLNTTLRHSSTPPHGSPVLSGADSPRTAVADQLRGMKLEAIPMSPLTPIDDGLRKKPKLEDMRQSSMNSLSEMLRDSTTGVGDKQELNDDNGDRHTKAGRAGIKLKVGQNKNADEVPETPEHAQPRLLPEQNTFAQNKISTAFNADTAARVFKQPPMQAKKKETSGHGTSPSQPRRKSQSPPPPNLTWKDDEITGHLVDPNKDPDDDGTGLNGIGFMPTPAMAQVRAQKRRQQLTEWRAREAREARAKRSERRKRGVDAGGRSSRKGTVEKDSMESEGKRTVRFAA